MATVFLRLLAHDDKAAGLAQVVDRLNVGKMSPDLHIVDPESFRQVPGSPFGYWVSGKVRGLFKELEAFESESREVRVGLQTSDDLRFLRAWWEVAPSNTLSGTNQKTGDGCRLNTFDAKSWVPFAKGGEASQYYSDLHLVVEWSNDGQAIKDFVVTVPGTTHWSRRVASDSHYFRPGLTWPLRASRFSPCPLPAGSIFSVRGYSIFADRDHLPVLCGIGNSSCFDYLFKLLLGRFGFPEFVVGILQQLPFPNLPAIEANALRTLSLKCSIIKMRTHTFNELSHFFLVPALLDSTKATLAEGIASQQARLAEAAAEIVEHQREIDDIAFSLYGIDRDDRRAMEEAASSKIVSAEQVEANDEEAVDDTISTAENKPLSSALISYAIGCVIGRWDIRYATRERPTPDLPDPFDPLPVCSPGMLRGDDGLPLQATPAGYPFRIDWDGILVDDPDHSDDIIRRVRDVFEVIWNHRAEAIEKEACEILGISELRDYFRKPGSGGFWDDHIKRYSKSRRKAPIYWLLQSTWKNYAIWIYYHRLDKDLLFQALMNYVEPKIRLEESRLESLRSHKSADGDIGKEAKRLAKEIERQEYFLSELRDFEDKLRRAANLQLEPDLNDGVVLNIASLHELVPWKEARKYWEELLEGKYEWSSIGKELREKGLVKC